MIAVILGGSLPGIRKALTLRQQGWAVVLCVESTYVAEEWTATWAGYSNGRQALLEKALSTAGIVIELPFLPGKVKREALKVLLDAGVDVRFMTRAAGLLKDSGQICGVMLAQKGGLYCEDCDLLLDASLYHMASARMRNQPVMIPAHNKISFFLEYRGIFLNENPILSKTEVLEPGSLAEDHAYLHVFFVTDADISLDQARSLMWHQAVSAAKRLAQDERFPKLQPGPPDKQDGL